MGVYLTSLASQSQVSGRNEILQIAVQEEPGREVVDSTLHGTQLN